MKEIADVLLDFFVIFVLAKAAAEVFHRLRQPVVIGELLVGVAIGPHALRLIDVPLLDKHEGLAMVYEVMTELGLVVLLFFVGLETRVTDLLRVGGRSLTVAVLGLVLPFALGTAFMGLTGHSRVEALFVGTALAATSVGITARVLRDMGVLSSNEARIILGAAVADDIMALLALTAVTQIGKEGGVDARELIVTAVVAIAFVAFTAAVGTHVVQRYSLHLERLRMENAPLAVALALMLGLSATAGQLGLAGIVGAFLAGMMLAESREQLRLERRAMPIYEFLVPFFFVLTGAKVDLGAFKEGGTIGLALAITSLAIAGKLLGCGAAGYGLGRRSMLIVGVGMVPRGEIGFVVASIALAQGSIGADVFSSVVFMSIATTLLVPPVLNPLYRGPSRRAVGKPEKMSGPAAAS